MTVHLKGASGFEPVVSLTAPAVIGELTSALPPGRLWQIDDRGSLDVRLARGALAGIDRDGLLDGGNLAAVGSPEAGWELLQFQGASLVGPRLYRLTGFLRGQGGTEAMTALGAPAGSRFVLIDRALQRLPIGVERIGRSLTLRVGPADRRWAIAP